MAIPTTVTRRAEGNDFVASTGMLLSGVTGFTLRTGFYLTNSGNYPIETTISTIENFAFTVPSGIETPITTLAGHTTLIPFDFIAAMPSSGPVGTATSTGPDHDGTWRTQLNLSTRSAYDNQQDPDGVIKLYITGQATGRSSVAGTVGAQGALDWADTLPENPSGFLVKSNYEVEGKPQADLRWQHPETGYYLVRYKLESATNIDNDNSSATGTWSHEAYFNVNYIDTFIPPLQAGGGYWTADDSYAFRKYATPTGIFQRHTYGTANNEETPYGEIKLGERAFGVDYYYRMKSQYFNHLSSAEIFESPYVYAYPVTEFREPVPSDVAAGLESGSATLPSASSSNIKVDRQKPQPLKIYFENGQENINLYDTVTAELSKRGLDKTALTTGDANFTFSGIHWIVPEGHSVGSTDSSKAGIDTGSQLLNSSTTHQQEITGVLVLETNSTVAGRGGDGGNGGYVTIDQFNVNVGSQRVSITAPVQSTDGFNGTAGIRISDANIDKFSISKDVTARVVGGGGGGGAGDPLVQPKIFDLNTQKIHQIQFRESMLGAVGEASMYLGKLGSGLQENDSTGKPTVKIDLAAPSIRVPITIQFGIKTYIQYFSTYSVDFTLSDIVGIHNAGVGGGGQGFGNSSPGKFLNISKRPLDSEGYGSLTANGMGSSSAIKLSGGASGGLLGLDGDNGISIDFDDFFQPSTAIDGNKTTAKDGGAAGYAIDATGNTNYTKANMRQKLCRIKGADVENISSFSEIAGLVAHFDAGQNVYEDAAGVDPAEDGDLVKRWSSVNDASNIYMVQQDASSSAPTYQSNSASVPAKYFDGSRCVYFDSNSTRPFSFSTTIDKRLKIVGITGTDKIEDGMTGFDIFYSLAPLSTSPAAQVWYLGADGFDSWFLTRYLHGWSSTQIEGLSEYSQLGYSDSVFPGGGGVVADNTGLGTNTVYAANEAASHPKESGYVWNISGATSGGFGILTLRRGMVEVATAAHKTNGFTFFDEPLIGGRGDDFEDKRQETSCQWWGGIAQLVVFNRVLTIKERAAVNNLLGQREMKVFATTTAEINSYQTENPHMINREPFRNVLADANNFGGFCVFDS